MKEQSDILKDARDLLMERNDFYHLLINNLDTEETLQICQQFYKEITPHVIYFINAHCFNISMKDEAYYKALMSADLVLNDGIGIKIASRFQRLHLKENMNGTDFIPKLLRQAAELNKKVFLLGGKDDIPLIAKTNIEARYPGIRVVGARSGYFTPEKNDSVIQMINKSGAELLVVAMGVPRQEIWLNQHLNHFQTIKLAVAGGAILDFMAQKVKRAPRWMQKMGIEWTYRLIQEPRRLFKRYIVGNIVFLSTVIVGTAPKHFKS